METPFGSGFKPEAAFAAAAERFFELLKTFGTGAAGQLPDGSSLAAPLAQQFEQWLRLSQSAGPWFAAGGAGFGAPAGLAAAAPGAFGPLPLGPAAAPAGDAARTFELLSRLTQLQGQLAAHWSEVANTAARRFVARLGATAGTPPTADQAMKLYELWVNCAEEAYAATVHKADFSRLQAEIANTSAALLVEQRRHAEALVRAFGLPTRNEVDALYAQVKELRRQLAAIDPTAAGDAPAAGRRQGAPRKRARTVAPRRSGKRPRRRGPRN
jgi:Poly(R)-hydroxyalkanoic acid synthase subunit (PHA_synth_III_E)